MKIPKFLLYGEADPKVELNIQPQLALRNWVNLSDEEKQIAFQQLKNSGWVESYSTEILQTIEYLNNAFLRQCPGKHLHAVQPQRDHYRGGYGNESERMKAAITDFQHIFLREKSDAMVFRMLSKFAESHIDHYNYRRANETQDDVERKKLLDEAFNKFDRLANCLSPIFEQFAVNQLVTRNGFVPRQDDKITKEVYTPTLSILVDPKWKSINNKFFFFFF